MQNLTCLATILMVAGCAASVPSPTSPRQASVLPRATSWPALSAGQTFYTITKDDLISPNKDIISFPDNLRVTVSPGITKIGLTASTIEIGKNVILDLGISPTSKPSTPPDWATEGQHSYCGRGDDGNRGHPGTAGANGIDLTITGVQQINNNGALWIRTDGGPGGDGGKGQDGQQGGGGTGGPFPCRAKDGGYGGPPGFKGIGGRKSEVSIMSLISTDAGGCNGLPSPTQAPTEESPPAEWFQNAGTISIYGRVGCDGAAGRLSGNHGPRG